MLGTFHLNSPSPTPYVFKIYKQYDTCTILSTRITTLHRINTFIKLVDEIINMNGSQSRPQSHHEFHKGRSPSLCLIWSIRRASNLPNSPRTSGIIQKPYLKFCKWHLPAEWAQIKAWVSIQWAKNINNKTSPLWICFVTSSSIYCNIFMTVKCCVVKLRPICVCDNCRILLTTSFCLLSFNNKEWACFASLTINQLIYRFTQTGK